jgi:hypothetical protein
VGQLDLHETGCICARHAAADGDSTSNVTEEDLSYDRSDSESDKFSSESENDDEIDECPFNTS